jgi:transcriptional regulator, ArsR family
MALLFSHPEQQYTVSQIADATRASLPTVSREVNRLEQSGLVTAQNVGRTRMVQAKVDNPVGQAMRQLILVTYGPVPVLRDTLQGISNIEGAAIYGSWASRRSGVAGHVPNDIDVLVVGSPSRQKLYEAIDDAEQKLGYEVNVKRLSHEAWNSQDGFVQTVRSRPMEVLFGQLEVNDVDAEA